MTVDLLIRIAISLQIPTETAIALEQSYQTGY